VAGGLLLAVAGLDLRRRRNGLRALRAAGPRAVAAVAGGGIMAAAYQLCFFAAVSRAGVATATVVAIGSSPVFTGLLARLLLGSALSRAWMLATVGAVTGCAVLVTGGHVTGAAQPAQRLGVVLALAAGAGYAVYGVLASGLIRSGLAPRTVMGAIFGTAAVLLSPVLALSSPGWILSPRGLLVTAHLAIVATFLAYLLYGTGLRVTPVATAATLSLAEPATAALLGLVVLGEHLTVIATAGLALLGMSLIVLTLPRGEAGGA
jgi:DME family drug/metabolite transporter